MKDLMNYIEEQLDENGESPSLDLSDIPSQYLEALGLHR